ncbi:MAG TPA: hypothetical protein VH083_27705 [Myxococcales bacterium]|nr:hypothetical protein [Myxococcales bacterium]
MPCAVRAAEAYPAAQIDRPLVLPAGKVELGLLGNLTNWSSVTQLFTTADPTTASVTGEAGVVGIEVGLGRVQLGAALALPLNPGFSYGSLFGSASIALSPATALRLDFGVDRIGNSGDISGFRPVRLNSDTSVHQYSFGVGMPFKVRLSPGVALVGGSVGAMTFAHFTHLGSNGSGTYLGAGLLMFDAADNVVYSFAGTGDYSGFGSTRVLALNLPLGLLFQATSRLSVTLHAGYLALLDPSGSSARSAAHFLPVGIDVVFASPEQNVDLGASFSLAGPLQSTTYTPTGFVGGYFDLQMATIWLRYRT